MSQDSLKKRGKSAEKRKPELLAPAGTVEMFFTALEQGADALYVGTERFNARLRASNFSIDELARLIAYAHGIDRKVYVTLNTLIKEGELTALVETLDALGRIAPDALIVQDLGVFRLARRLVPGIALHASTQMTIHNLDGALQAERMGFERAILARELTLEEITSMRRGCKIELETFVHGAMCYCISGQCNFSSFIHGKSANRGQCLQPCRRLFDVAGVRLPMFATLDLSTAPILFQLISSGIRSFKIEGRLKPAETIGQVVAAYRLLIDAYPTMTKEVVEEARERIKLAIGRRQSTGFYLSSKPKESMIGEGMSRSGRYLGKASGAIGGTFSLKTREIIKIGDRLSVQKGRAKPPQAFKVKQLQAGKKPIFRSRPNREVTITAPFDVENGSGVVKLIDADAVTREAKRHEDKKWSKARARSKAVVEASFGLDLNSAVVLDGEVGGQPVRVETWPSYEAYLPPARALEILNSERGKPGLRLRVAECADFDDQIPMGEEELEEFRQRMLREAGGRLDAMWDEVLTELRYVEPRPKAKAVVQTYVRLASLKGAGGLLKRPDTTLIVPLRETAAASFADMFGDASARESLFLELPDFAFGHGEKRDELLAMLKQAVQSGLRQFVVSNLAHFQMLKAYEKRGLRLIAADGLHCMNSMCAEQLADLGVSHAVFSQEGDRATLDALGLRLGKASFIVQVYGKVPLFRSRHPKPRGTQASSVVSSRDELDVLKRDGLTYVVPRRDFSLRHLVSELSREGYGGFLYDLSFEKPSAKLFKSIVRGRDQLDLRVESSMNFEGNLE